MEEEGLEEEFEEPAHVRVPEGLEAMPEEVRFFTVLRELNKGGVYGGVCEWSREGAYGVSCDG